MAADPKQGVDPDPSGVDDALRMLKPRMRDVVEQVDPSMLDAFDAVYDDGAADVAAAILRPGAARDELAGEQALGLRGHLAANVVAFLVNVAAALAVERCHSDFPQAWALLSGSSPVSVAATRDPVDRLVDLSHQSKEDKERLGRAIRRDPRLMSMIGSARHP